MVADSTEQAREDLCREWSASKALWVSDLGSSGYASAVERQELSAEREYAIRLNQLVAHREAIVAAISLDHSKQLGLLNEKIAEHEKDLEDLDPNARESCYTR